MCVEAYYICLVVAAAAAYDYAADHDGDDLSGL